MVSIIQLQMVSKEQIRGETLVIHTLANALTTMRQGHNSLFIPRVEEGLPPPLALPLQAPLQEVEAWRPRPVEVYCLQEVED